MKTINFKNSAGTEEYAVDKVRNVNEANTTEAYLRLWRGTSAEYTALGGVYDPNTLYIILD